MISSGLRVGQVRVIFSIRPSSLPTDVQVPKHLAFIQLFSPFPAQPDPNHGMYWIKPCIDDNGQRTCVILPLTTIERSIHLFPKFGPIAPWEWTSSTVLDECPSFYANCWSDRHVFIIVQ
jgi:hypothetical protein